MFKSVTGAASLVRQLHLQGGTPIAPQTEYRKKGLTKLGLAMMQSAVLLVGGFMVTSQASATDYCHPAGDGTYQVTNGIQSPYVLSIYLKGVTNPNSNCMSYYGNTNYVTNWNLGSNTDLLSGFGDYHWNVAVDSAKISAKAYHNHKYTATNGGRNYFALYGRFQTGNTPNTDEWYIIDDWYGQLPPKDGPGLQYQGQITIDTEGTYDVYYDTLANGTLQQWWSIRTTPRTSGYISYVRHFQQWRINPAFKYHLRADTLTNTYFMIEVNKFPGSGQLVVSSIDMTSYPPQ